MAHHVDEATHRIRDLHHSTGRDPVPLEEAPPSRGGAGRHFADEQTAALFNALEELLMAGWVEPVEPGDENGYGRSGK
jgi:hypothetical protein